MTKLDDLDAAVTALVARGDALMRPARADAAGKSGAKVLSGSTEIDLGGGHGYVEVEYTIAATYSFDFDLKAVKSVDWGSSTPKAARAGLQSVIERKLRAHIAGNTRDLVDELSGKL